MPSPITPTIQEVMESPIPYEPGDKISLLLSLGYTEQEVLDAGYTEDQW